MSTQKKISDIFAKATSGDSQTGETLTPTHPDIDESPSASVSHSASSSTSWKPNYPDFFVLSEDEIRSAKMKLLKTTWDTAHKFEFPVRMFNGKPRRFKSAWLEKHPWMRYSIVKDAVYCIYCALFRSQRSDAKERTFGKSSPVSDWTNLSKFVSRHRAQTSSHHDNVRAGEEFIRVGEGNKTDVVTQLSTHHHEAIEKNRHIIKEIIKVLVFCGKQNIAIRGHTEEKSNFAALLNLQVENDSILAAHMAPGDPRRKYTSPTIQNELIELCANQIRESLTKACNLSGCFGFIADEATDCATREQIAICVRFFDHEKGEVCENVFGFKEADRTTGEALAEKFIQTLEDYRIEIGKMRGQGYDGAANMAGIHRGVQARIRERIPLATYTHCRAHSLNLAIVHACKEPLIRNLMNTVQTIAFAFDYSAKRLLKFEESLELNADAKEAMERKTKLKTLCETRWFSRIDALSTFLKCYGVVMSSLQELADDGDSKARSYVCSIRQFDFIVALVTAEHVLTPVNPLSALLQGKSQDLLEAVKECRAVVNVLREERSDDSVWDAIYAKSVEIGTKHDVAATVPRVVARQRHRLIPHPNIGSGTFTFRLSTI